MADIYVSPLVPEAAEARAARGAALLDTVRPGWAQAVWTSTLDQGNGQMCVLGQVFGGYRAGLVMVGISNFSYAVVEYGFVPHSRWLLDSDNPQLTSAWAAEIARRVAADAEKEE